MARQHTIAEVIGNRRNCRTREKIERRKLGQEGGREDEREEGRKVGGKEGREGDK